MHFDLFYELSVPKQFKQSEQQVFNEALDEWALADQLAFHTAWLVEHHFMPEYSHSTAPELFMAAASQRTQNLRLGHGIVPLPYHHPIRVAEKLATLDVLSGGRVDFGYGRGFSPKEYQCFNVAMADSRDITQEALDIVRQSFRSQTIKHTGKHFQFDDIDILPRYIQTEMPVWAAAVSPDSYSLAAEQQANVLVGPFKPWFMVKEDIKRYREAWQQHHGENSRGKVGMTVGILCLENKKEARRIGKPGLEWFYHQLLSQTKPVLEKLYDSYEYYNRMGHLHTLLGKAVNLTVLETMGMAIVGDPDHCIKKLRKLQEHGVDHVLCAIGAGTLPTEITQQSMRLLSSEVMPHFQTK